MGGDRFPNTQRLGRDDLKVTYKIIRSAVLAHEDLRDCVKCTMPPELSDKESFGDLDVTIAVAKSKTKKETCQVHQLIVNAVTEATATTALEGTVSSTVSLLTSKNFQIDLDFVPEEYYDFAVAMHAHGDFAWLLGRTLRPHGLKLTNHGLYVRKNVVLKPKAEKESTKLCEDFCLTSCPKKLAAFLQIPKDFFDGVTVKRSLEVFRAIAQSRFFSASGSLKSYHKVLLGERNHEENRRLMKRPMYSKFHEWLLETSRYEEAHMERPDFISQDSINSLGSLDIDSVVQYFGREEAWDEAYSAAQQITQDQETRLSCKHLINGKTVLLRNPNLSGPMVGAVLREMFKKYGGDSWSQYRVWLCAQSEESLQSAIQTEARKLNALSENTSK